MITIENLKFADYGFFINLDTRTDRFEKITTQLAEIELNGVQRQSAYSLTDSGPTNCKHSHYSVFEEFLKTDGNTLLVLEDDCLFLDNFKNNYTNIIDDINNTDWDLFWLGCRNRRTPKKYKNNTYKVSSVSHAQSYLIKRNLCEHILQNYPINQHTPIAIDELLCLMVYGSDVVEYPEKYNFYDLDSPIDVLPTKFTALCYKEALTTQYASYSDLSKFNVDYEEYITSSYPQYYD
jgi:GR25 family glycosyltransferase involved in LPS biosynthesis